MEDEPDTNEEGHLSHMKEALEEAVKELKNEEQSGGYKYWKSGDREGRSIFLFTCK